MKTKFALFVVVLFGVTVFLTSFAEWVAKEQKQDYIVSIILFYPSDASQNHAYENDINESVENVRDWFQLQLGRTFTYTPVEVVVGEHDSAWYENIEPYLSYMDKSLAIRNELENKGYNLELPSKGYLIFIQVEMLAHNRTLGDNACYFGKHFYVRHYIHDDWESSAARGLIAHEIGHAFGGLSHLYDNSNSVMSPWGNYPNAPFSENEKSELLKSRFFIG